jgi:cyclic beta-1,2-glucan synthetase
MASVKQWLIKPEQGLALLFTPPFDNTPQEPGYIKGYPPGLRENGGQYSHAAMWAILAYTELGEAQIAYDLFTLLNPINHARDAQQSARYKVEPYVVAADVYSVAPHLGRGGWTWYTGAAGWMYRAGMEGILGIHREGNQLTIRPCIPAVWPGFEASIHVENTDYTITLSRSAEGAVEGSAEGSEQALAAVLDGVKIVVNNNTVCVPLEGGKHRLEIVLAATAIAKEPQ